MGSNQSSIAVCMCMCEYGNAERTKSCGLNTAKSALLLFLERKYLLNPAILRHWRRISMRLLLENLYFLSIVSLRAILSQLPLSLGAGPVKVTKKVPHRSGPARMYPWCSHLACTLLTPKRVSSWA